MTAPKTTTGPRPAGTRTVPQRAAQPTAAPPKPPSEPCPLCWPQGWPEGSYAVGCEHGSTIRTP